MTATKVTVDQKIDNVQDQLDVMRREDAVFKGYVHRQFDVIAKNMATKDDLYRMEARMEAKMDTKFATKDDLRKLTEIVIKIAEKVGVTT